MMGIVDVHSHILPNVDDGAGNLQEAISMIQMEYEQGVRKIILTPHYRRGYFEVSREKVRNQFRELSAQLEQIELEMQLYLGCEFYRQNEIVRLVESDRSFRMADSRYVLLEFMPTDLADTIVRYTVELLINGYRPVIAHVERYQAFRDEKLIQRLVNSGAYLQVNAGSIIGQNGWNKKRFCKKLLREKCVHFVGSDAHNMRSRVPCMGACAEYLKKKIGQEETKRLLSRNPEMMLSGEFL